MGTETSDDNVNSSIHVLRRGWPIIAITTAVFVVLALLFSARQDEEYEASSQVFVTQSVESSIAGVPVLSSTPERIIATQAEVARVPAVAELAVKEYGDESISADDLLDNSAVIPDDATDLLTFQVNWGDEKTAEGLSDAYALGYSNYRTQIETGAIKQAQRQVEAELDQAKENFGGQSPETLQLLEESQRLRTLAISRGSSTSLGTPAEADKVAPRPIRNGFLAGVFGFILGFGLVFLRESLNTRMREPGDVEAILGMPLLGRIAPPPKDIDSETELVSLVKPHSPEAEAFRMLATNVEIVNIDRGATTFLVTSALHSEGKSTTIANLALAFAKRGVHVVLVEADVRRPVLRKMFQISPDAPGLAEVALRGTPLDDALATIEIPLEEGEGAEESATAGKLEVLVGDPAPPSPADFLRSTSMADLLGRLEERADIVLIDTPPVLYVSDALSVILGPSVDCVIVAARVEALRRNHVEELRRSLDGVPAVKLGFFASGQSVGMAYGTKYGYGTYYSNGSGPPRGLVGRALGRGSKAETGEN